MVVKAPRRPPPRRVNAGREFRESEALREQALIEEARRRARRRRRRNLAVVLLALIPAAALGLGPAVGDQVGGRLADEPSHLLGGGAKVRNGQIAVTDGSALQVVNPDGTGLHAGADCPSEVGCRILEPAWSPDGTRLAFVRGGLPSRNAPRPAMSVYVTSGPGGATKLAACGVCVGNLDWSPDGAELAFSRDASAREGRYQSSRWIVGSSSLWIVDSHSGQLRRLTECGSKPCTDLGPDWSPDGQLILFSRSTGRGGSLYTVRADGTGLTRLDTPPGGHPVWSPDGRKIAFATGDGIYVADADGGHGKSILDGPQGSLAGMPAWSPDGKKLAFLQVPAVPGRAYADLSTIDPNGSHKRVVAALSCCGSGWALPVWSPDGTQIAFAVDSAGGTFVVNANGTDLHKVSAAHAVALAWQRAQ